MDRVIAELNEHDFREQQRHDEWQRVERQVRNEVMDGYMLRRMMDDGFVSRVDAAILALHATHDAMVCKSHALRDFHCGVEEFIKHETEERLS